jgi:hypothetical protein
MAISAGLHFLQVLVEKCFIGDFLDTVNPFNLRNCMAGWSFKILWSRLKRVGFGDGKTIEMFLEILVV